jgi:ABC-type transport system involved in multi-copper enzyme maturation permease subunit
LTKNFKKVLSDFYASLGRPYNSNTALVNLISFKLSSLVITATASITDTNDSSSIYSSINSNLQKTSKIASYPVATYSTQPVGFTPTDSTTSEGSSNVGLIIGIVIGILVFIVLVIVAVWCYRKRKQNAEGQV